MSEQTSTEEFCLKQDNGCDFVFHGRLFSECSWFDEGLGMLIRQKLYVTDQHDQIYYIVRSSGQKRTRHAYRLSMHGDTCVINNGLFEMPLQFDLLMLAVRGLCGLEAGATPTLASVEEMLKAANA